MAFMRFVLSIEREGFMGGAGFSDIALISAHLPMFLMDRPARSAVSCRRMTAIG